MNDPLEIKRQRIQTGVKVLGLGALCLILGPVFILMLQGMAALMALGVASVIAFTAISFLPAFSAAVANWRLKALKAVASANPIETLENIYADRKDALIKIRENIQKSYAVLQNLYAQIQDHDQSYPGKPSQYLDKYNKLKALIQLRGEKYKQAQKNLAEFSEVIDEKRSDWKIAQTMAEASKLANVGEDFQSKLMSDTALNTIQDGLNMAFSELETSLLDEQPSTAVTLEATPVKAIPSKCGPPTLDLGIDTDEPEKDSIIYPRHKFNTR